MTRLTIDNPFDILRESFDQEREQRDAARKTAAPKLRITGGTGIAIQGPPHRQTISKLPE